MDSIRSRARLLLAAPLLIALAAPAYAQTAENWMRDYVRLRVLERELRAIPQALTPMTRAQLDAQLGPRIVGGTPAGPTDNPFQVALLNRTQPDNFAAQFCGGTLVRENFVVTAAHCSDFVAANAVQVLTGSRRLDASGVRRDVTRITVHPNWNAATFDHDVAVWELATAATGAPVASLATDDGPVGADLLATGWGALAEGGTRPVDLRRVLLPLVDRANCNDANSYNGQISDNMLCAGRDAGGTDTCQGDSGGPLTRGPNNSVLTGITSWGTGCARPNLFGVYTRVSRPIIRDFIVATAGLASSPGTSVSCTVFDDGYTNPSPVSDAVYFAGDSAACTPDGTAKGNCRKWFGRCTTVEAAPRGVRFRAFDDGDSNVTPASDAVYNRAPNRACVPDGTGTGACRRWFGLADSEDGRPVRCYLFNDGYADVVGPTHAIYYRAPGSVCMPDGSAQGTCRKWFGRCRAG